MLTDLGSAQLWAGRFEAARSTLSVAVQAADGPATAFPRHEALGRLALIDFLHGRPGQAEAHAREAIAEADRSGLPVPDRTGVARLVLAAVAIDRDDLTAARDHLDLAAATSAAGRDPVVAVELAVLRSRMLCAAGDARAALLALDSMAKRPLVSTEPSPWVSDRVSMATAAAYLADGDPKAAVRVFEDRRAHGLHGLVAEAWARAAAGESERALRVLDGLPDRGRGPALDAWILLTRAQAVDALGRSAAAESLVLRALTAARPHQLRRPFLEAGPWFGRLLRRRAGLAAQHAWLTGSLSRRSADARAPEEPSGPRPQALSTREHDVLERLAQLMSTEEIAADLYLSVNTVKTHLKSIYRKLDATRRGEAVRRARELGLL